MTPHLKSELSVEIFNVECLSGSQGKGVCYVSRNAQLIIFSHSSGEIWMMQVLFLQACEMALLQALVYNFAAGIAKQTEMHNPTNFWMIKTGTVERSTINVLVSTSYFLS